MGFSNAELARRTEQARPIIERLVQAGCRFMQMEMPDLNGSLRGKLVPLEKGLTASGTGIGAVVLTFKSGGYRSLATPFSGTAETGFPKIVAIPDLSTAVALPWKRDVAAVLCDYYLEDGSPCALSPRHLLRLAESAIAERDYGALVALEHEFYIVHEDDALMRQARYEELLSFQRGVDLWSLSRAPSFEDLAKEFMTRCESVGIPVEAFHTEHGHGMFEYTFVPQSPLKAADDCARAKLYMRQLCAERGLVACYMAAKVFNGEGAAARDTFSGCHHNFSLTRASGNAFWDSASQGLSAVARQAAAGILESMPAFNLLYRPWVNSYRRMSHLLGAPENASWGKEHHLAALRVVHGAAPHKLTRLEHRVPGADVNPYLSIASILHGALHGIKESLTPPPYASGDVMLEKNGAKLPRTLPGAIEYFSKSRIAAAAFGADFVNHLAMVKQEEWHDFTLAVAAPEVALAQGPVTRWELERYFVDA